MKRLWAIAASATLSASACATEARELAFEVLLTGFGSQINHAAIYYILGENEWREFWASHRGDDFKNRPEVDFDKHSVIAFLAGHRGSAGYKVAIERIAVHPNKLSLEVHELYPGAGCAVIDMPTRPFQLVKIARRQPIEVLDFSLIRTARKCE